MKKTQDMPKKADVQEAFYLSAVQVMFVDGEQNTGVTTANVMIRSSAADEGRITAKLLGRAQQAAQIQVAQKIKDPTLKFLDVIILGISYLGIMTEAQFLEGTDQAGAPVDEAVN